MLSGLRQIFIDKQGISSFLCLLSSYVHIVSLHKRGHNKRQFKFTIRSFFSLDCYLEMKDEERISSTCVCVDICCILDVSV